MTILQEIEVYVRNCLLEQMPENYVYHDLQHTINVVNACEEIGVGNNLSYEEKEILAIAAWFHDIGYIEGPTDHEQRGAIQAETFLKARNYAPHKIELIKGCILATKMPQNPQTRLQTIICDADLNHLGKKNYWYRCDRLRLEFAIGFDKVMTDDEWIDFEIAFLKNHKFTNDYASQLFDTQKAKHLKKLIKLKKHIKKIVNASQNKKEIGLKKKQKKKKAKSKKSQQKKISTKGWITEERLGRGVETMFRTTYRTHVNLSSIADNKANIMLSINAIILSIVVSTLVPKFTDYAYLIIPTCILISVCLVTIVYATLSTRPKVTEGKFTKEDILERRSNLLFFGNFYNMSLPDYEWGMQEMIQDQEFQYLSMTRDLYFLGKVLAKKYRYLSICYNVFMYGLIISMIGFVVAFLLE